MHISPTKASRQAVFSLIIIAAILLVSLSCNLLTNNPIFGQQNSLYGRWQAYEFDGESVSVEDTMVFEFKQNRTLLVTFGAEPYGFSQEGTFSVDGNTIFLTVEGDTLEVIYTFLPNGDMRLYSEEDDGEILLQKIK
jgi:hypothetical protein